MRTFILSCLLLAAGIAAQAQNMRYFEFTTTCGHGNWQDTAFVAATADAAVIADVLAELQKPREQRKFIAGKIDYGHGGFNHNAHHWFLWHHVPGQWHLADVAMEVCDGCPYSDVDQDTAYWVRNIGEFCSWGGNPVREVQKPTTIGNTGSHAGIYYYPNPAKDKLYIERRVPTGTTVLAIYTIAGEEVLREVLPAGSHTVDITALANGLYFTRLGSGEAATYGRLVVEK